MAQQDDDIKGIQNRAFVIEENNENDIKDKNSYKTDFELEETLAPIDEVPHQKKKNPLKPIVRITLRILIHIAVGVYFGYATYYYVDHERYCQASDLCGMQFCDGYGLLVLLVGFIYFGLFYYLILKPKAGRRLYRAYLKPFNKWWMKVSRTQLVSSITIALLLIAFGIFLYFETHNDTQKLVGLTAPCFFILCGFVFSTKRRAIKWRTVITGITSQFILGLICIRWSVGRQIFQCIGKKVETFLNFTEYGNRFVFGDNIVDDKVFAFAVLPVIFFFSFFISIMYYLGVMQWVVMKLGWMLQQLLGTTVCESVTAAANIFLGMSESPLLIRPYIKLLTPSEIHAIMVSGFATVSGTVLAAYMSYGASPAHLITSSVMAAPATLAFSKLFMPETEESKTTKDNIELEKSEDASILDAAVNGASTAIPIILGIIANIVAFVAFVAFLNSVVNWFGLLIGLNDDFDFEWMLAKVFMPVAWAIGIPWNECDKIGKVIATKTIINEFVAYERLGELISNEEISARSAGIATYAICGFGNPSSLGILIGSLSALAPNKRSIFTTVAIRAVIVGTIVCFVSASFAGLLIQEEVDERIYSTFFNKERLNSTTISSFLRI